VINITIKNFKKRNINTIEFKNCIFR